MLFISRYATFIGCVVGGWLGEIEIKTKLVVGKHQGFKKRKIKNWGGCFLDFSHTKN